MRQTTQHITRRAGLRLLAALLLAVGLLCHAACLRDGATSCTNDRDCFAGEVCGDNGACASAPGDMNTPSDMQTPTDMPADMPADMTTPVDMPDDMPEQDMALPPCDTAGCVPPPTGDARTVPTNGALMFAMDAEQDAQGRIHVTWSNAHDRTFWYGVWDERQRWTLQQLPIQLNAPDDTGTLHLELDPDGTPFVVGIVRKSGERTQVELYQKTQGVWAGEVVTNSAGGDDMLLGHGSFHINSEGAQHVVAFHQLNEGAGHFTVWRRESANKPWTQRSNSPDARYGFFSVLWRGGEVNVLTNSLPEDIGPPVEALVHLRQRIGQSWVDQIITPVPCPIDRRVGLTLSGDRAEIWGFSSDEDAPGTARVFALNTGTDLWSPSARLDEANMTQYATRFAFTRDEETNTTHILYNADSYNADSTTLYYTHGTTSLAAPTQPLPELTSNLHMALMHSSTRGLFAALNDGDALIIRKIAPSR